MYLENLDAADSIALMDYLTADDSPRDYGIVFGSVDRRSKNVTTDKTKTCETSKEPLTPQWTPETQKQDEIDNQKLPADLAEIVQRWLHLSDAIRLAIVAIVRASR